MKLKVLIFSLLSAIFAYSNTYSTIDIYLDLDDLLYEETRGCPPPLLPQILEKVCDILAITTLIEEEVNGTLTVIINTLDITGVYTALNNLEEDIFSSQTIICDKFQQTWTIIGQLNNDIFDTQTILCAKYLGTFTALAGIESITEAFEATWTILGCLQSQALAAPTLITVPGSYCLKNDIVGTITIAADRVFLDLNQKQISGAETLVSCESQSDIIIKNGILAQAGGSAVVVNTCTNVLINGVDFVSNATGIAIDSGCGIAITNCSFVRHNDVAITLHNSNASILKNLSILDNQAQVLLDIRSCDCLTFEQSSICQNTFARQGGSPVYNPIFIDGLQNGFISSCNVDDNTLSNSSGMGTAHAYMWFVNNAENIEFHDCSASSNSCEMVTSGSFIGFNVLNTTGIFSENCLIGNNSLAAGNSFYGSLVTTTSGVRFIKMFIENNSNSENLTAVRLEAVFNASLFSCLAVNNSSERFTLFDSSMLNQNSLIKWCSANNNVGSGGMGQTSYCFLASGTGCIFDGCSAQANTIVGSIDVFSVDGIGNCILNCIAKANVSSSETSQGFAFGSNSERSSTRLCIAKSNTGSVSSIGFINMGTDNVFLLNEAQGHGASGVGNYSGIPTGIISTLNPGTGFTSPTTPFNNISVVLP